MKRVDFRKPRHVRVSDAALREQRKTKQHLQRQVQLQKDIARLARDLKRRVEIADRAVVDVSYWVQGRVAPRLVQKDDAEAARG